LFHADRRTDSQKDMAPKIGVVNIIPTGVNAVKLLPEKWLL